MAVFGLFGLIVLSEDACVSSEGGGCDGGGEETARVTVIGRTGLVHKGQCDCAGKRVYSDVCSGEEGQKAVCRIEGRSCLFKPNANVRTNDTGRPEVVKAQDIAR